MVCHSGNSSRHIRHLDKVWNAQTLITYLSDLSFRRTLIISESRIYCNTRLEAASAQKVAIWAEFSSGGEAKPARKTRNLNQKADRSYFCCAWHLTSQKSGPLFQATFSKYLYISHGKCEQNFLGKMWSWMSFIRKKKNTSDTSCTMSQTRMADHNLLASALTAHIWNTENFILTGFTML